MSKFKGLLITVNYNSWNDVEKFYNSFLQCKPGKGVKFVVVDNDSETRPNDTFLQKLKFRGDEVLQLDSNYGYFGAAKQACNRIETIGDFFIISNPDIEILCTKFFQPLRFLLKENFSDVIAPKIVSEGQKNQNPHRLKGISTSLKVFYKIYFSNYYISKLIRYILPLRVKKRDEDMLKDGQHIFSAHGAFIIFSRDYFEKGGFIDDGYFLYGEEDSIAGICKEKNLSIRYTDKLKVYHHEGVSTNLTLSRKKFEWQSEAYKYINNRYGLFKLLT